jgi:hypothetical protein
MHLAIIHNENELQYVCISQIRTISNPALDKIAPVNPPMVKIEIKTKDK